MTSPLFRPTLVSHSLSTLRPFTRLSSSSASSSSSNSTASASSFLARQALQEEQELLDLKEKNKRQLPELREPVWDGEETRERMLKRILEDQYKPLRVKVSPLYYPLSLCVRVRADS